MIDEEETVGPSFDGRGLHIMAEQCDTCIFRTGNPMRLRRGRVREMTRLTDQEDSNVICHKTLDRAVTALCRGSVNRRPGQAAQVALRLGLVVDDE